MQNLNKNNWAWLLPAVALLVAIIGGVPGLISIINFCKAPTELSVNFENIAFGETVENSKHLSTVFLTVTISNKGDKPLTPAFFDFEYKIGKQWVRFEKKLIPHNLELGSQEQIINISEPYEGDLQRYNKPISYAFPVQGFLFFVSKDVKLEELHISNSARLICTDIFGNTWIKNLPKIGEKLTTPKIYPKHGITVTPSSKGHPSSNITFQIVQQYYNYFLSKLRNRLEVKQYLDKQPNSPLIFPEVIQFIVSTTGTVIMHVGHNKSDSAKIEFYSFDIPYQKALFGENINKGKPAFAIDAKFCVLNNLVIGQKKARLNFPNKIDSIGGDGRYGDRLIDVTEDADVTLLSCFFHFMRNNQYESLCQEYIYINGSTDKSILSKSAADERINRLCSILKDRNP